MKLNGNNPFEPIKKLISTISGKAKEKFTKEDLPMIYIRPTIDNKIAVWPGHRMELDLRPNEHVILFNTLEEAEKRLPEIMEAVGRYYGVCYVYIDRMEDE